MGSWSLATRGRDPRRRADAAFTLAKLDATTLNDAVSDHSIGCLARLLTSARYRTRVTIQRLSLSELVARQLSDREPDPVFRESMTVARTLAQSLLS